MYAIWTLFLSNFKKSKIQNLFIALLILLSTLLIATAALIISNTGNLFTDMHNKTHGSHQILTMEKGIHDPQSVYQWWHSQAGVTTSNLMHYRTLSGIFYKGTDIPNLFLFMMDTPKLPFGVDELAFAQGNQSASPEIGSIWIPTSMAYSNKISLGDDISFKVASELMELKVSAIVVDLPYGAPFATSARIWMNSQDYKEKIASLPGKDFNMLGLRFEKYSENRSYWERFENFLGTPYLESKMEYEEITSFYLIINKVIGFVMIFLGIIMMLVALLTIGFTISDAIFTNYRTIGVLKSLGLTSGRTLGIYVTQYTFLSVISIIPGLILSIFLSKIIINSSLSSLKTENSEMIIHGTGTALAVGLLLFGLILLSVFYYANKTRTIQPMQAIRYGMSEIDNNKITRRMNSAGINKIGFENFSIFFVIGLRNIFKNIKGSSLMMVLAMMTSAVLVLGFLMLNSIINIQQTSPKWGYDSSNIIATIFNKSTFSRSDFEKEVKSDSRIKYIGWMGYVTGVIQSEQPSGTDKITTQSISIPISVADGSYDTLGFEKLRGNNPRNKNEIAIGVNVAKKLNKDLGDVIDVYIEGKKQTLIITGIYQAINNMSNSARITIDVVKAFNPQYNDMIVSYINVNDSSQSDNVASDLGKKFKDSVTVVTQQSLLDSVFKEAASVLIWPMSLMGLLFIIVTFIIIYSTCRTNIRKESKTYGIYKSMGMTSSRIRLSIALGIATLSALGALFGVLLGVYILPILLEKILANYGIVELPLILNWGGIIVIACISILSATLGSWASSKMIYKTSPRILVLE